MFTERTSVGLDVHARSVVAAAIDGVTGEVFKTRLVPSPEVVIPWVESLPGPSAAVYESGPTGFGLARSLTVAGIRCEVAASSKLQRPAGDRVKTDAAGRRDRLDTAIMVMAADCQFTPVVRRLSCLRGISTLTAFTLAVEIGDWDPGRSQTGTFRARARSPPPTDVPKRPGPLYCYLPKVSLGICALHSGFEHLR